MATRRHTFTCSYIYLSNYHFNVLVPACQCINLSQLHIYIYIYSTNQLQHVMQSACCLRYELLGKSPGSLQWSFNFSNSQLHALTVLTAIHGNNNSSNGNSNGNNDHKPVIIVITVEVMVDSAVPGNLEHEARNWDPAEERANNAVAPCLPSSPPPEVGPKACSCRPATFRQSGPHRIDSLRA